MYEYEATIPTMWGHVKGVYAHVSLLSRTLKLYSDFVKLHPEYIAKDNALGFMSNNGGDSYNLCHCMSLFSRVVVFRLYSLVASLEQLRDRGSGFLARARVHRIL